MRRLAVIWPNVYFPSDLHRDLCLSTLSVKQYPDLDLCLVAERHEGVEAACQAGLPLRRVTTHEDPHGLCLYLLPPRKARKLRLLTLLILHKPITRP